MNLNKITIKSPTEIIINKDITHSINIVLTSDKSEERRCYTLVKTKSNKLLLNRSTSL